jgi:hypothetical protein
MAYAARRTPVPALVKPPSTYGSSGMTRVEGRVLLSLPAALGVVSGSARGL